MYIAFLAMSKPRESTRSGNSTAAGAAENSDKKLRIGVINDDGTVTRRSHGEAVIAVSIQPVSRLIKQPFLKLALQLAMVNFIEEHIDKEGKFCKNHYLIVMMIYFPCRRPLSLGTK